MESKSRSSSTSSTYSHLLYLSSHDRDFYLSSQSSLQLLSATRPESTSFFSMSSSRCSSISSSTSSSLESVSTKPSSVKSATILTPKYADDHYPLITSIDPSSIITVPAGVSKSHAAFSCARKMAAIHNTMIRALNSAYNHAASVYASTPRCGSFLKFNQILCGMLDRHHEVEDNFLFPAWERLMKMPGAMEENKSSHNIFMEGFCVFREYVSNPDTAESFDAVVYRKIIQSFAPDLIQRLHDEIPTIVGLYTLDSDALQKIWEQADKLTTQDADMYSLGPMILGCQDKTFRIDGEIAPLSGLSRVTEVVTRKWYARKKSDVWEFCPSDLQGQRRLLQD